MAVVASTCKAVHNHPAAAKGMNANGTESPQLLPFTYPPFAALLSVSAE